MSESICQGRRCGRKRTFAGTERRIAALHQNNLNTGYLGKRQYGIARPVPARDIPLIEGNLLLPTETDGLDHASLDLVLRPVWIDDEPDIGRHHDAGNPDDACLAVDLHVY